MNHIGYMSNLYFHAVAYAQIDWHDFVVVETVLFNEADDQADLPAPTSLSDLQSASLEQKAMMSLAPHNMRIEEAMPTEEDTYYNNTNPYATQQQPPPMMHPPSIHAYQPLPPPIDNHPTAMDISPPTQPPTRAEDDDEESQQIRERTEARARARQAQVEAKGGPGAIKIRNDYVPRAAAQAANRRGVQMALCPNCKQQIAVNELEEHMRSTFHIQTPTSFFSPKN